MNRTSALIVVLMTLGHLAGCSADPDEGGAADPEPVGDPNTTVASAGDPAPVTTSIPTSAPETSPVTVAVAAGDEVYLDTSSGQLIHRDGNGAYICVLRRQDDLADLRAGFTGPPIRRRRRPDPPSWGMLTGSPNPISKAGTR